MKSSSDITNLKDLLWHVYETRWSGQSTGEASYKEALSFIDAIGDAPSSLTRYDLACYVASISRVKASTVNRKMRPVVTMLREGVALGVVPSHALEGWSWKKEDDPGFYVLSEKEEQAFLESECSLDFYDLFTVLIDTGMRVGEALGLRWADLTVGINQPSFVDLRADRVKNRKARRVYLTKRAAEVLRPRSDLLDPFEGYTYDRFHNEFTAIKAQLGITDPRCTPHCLRHTCATRLLKRGANIATVGKWLGHSSIKTTMRYVHADVDDLQAAAALLNG